MMIEEKTGNNLTKQSLDQILYGHGNLDRVTGVDVDGGGAAVLFQRCGDNVEQQTIKHRFFFILSEEKYAEGLDSDETMSLDGDGFYRHIFNLSNAGRAHFLNKQIGKININYPLVGYNIDIVVP